MTICPICNRNFHNARRHAEYCSPKCRKRRERERLAWDAQADMLRRLGDEAGLQKLGPRP
jgi:hypothetical protein